MTEENNEAPKPPVDDMVPLTPPTVPLFNIPDAVLTSMSKEVAPDLTQIQNPVEWIMKQRKLAEAQTAGPKMETPQTPPSIVSIPQNVVPIPQKNAKVPKVAWGGDDLNEEALTMLFFMVVKEVSKDKKIKKYLKDMKIEIYDINDQLLWP
jgi:hypothetical protein